MSKPTDGRLLQIAGTVGVVIALSLLVGFRLNSFQNSRQQAVAKTSTLVTPAEASQAAASTTPKPTPTPAPTVTVQSLTQTAIATATTAVSQVMAAHPGIDVSVSAYNATTGAVFNYGSVKGMVEGSTVKVNILISALVKGGGTLTAAQRSYAVPTIENSDNGAADSLFRSVGGNAGLAMVNKKLGLSATVLNPSGVWGLSTTSAADQIQLLKPLVTPSAISASGQAYALGLLRNVEDDQQWGVAAAADANSTFANKNGWLNVDNDGGRWLTNSDGVITVNGQTVLMSVLTQHNRSFDAGVSLVESLAKATAPAVAVTVP